MSAIPDTRYSLLLRIRDPKDELAWMEFWKIYEPAVYRLARRFGFQDADARDLTQDVLTTINSAIHDWQPDPKRGRFRTWLHTVVKNKAISAIRRQRPCDLGSGDTDMIRRLENQSIAPDETFETEVRRSAFQRAADQVRKDVLPATWDAFWRTSVLGRSIDEVAGELNLSIGSVYAARCRILARLRREIEAVLADTDE